jgi:ATP-dependent DNA helicase DinG
VAALNGWKDGGTLVLTPYHKRKNSMWSRVQAACPGTMVQMQAQGQGSATADKRSVELHKSDCARGNSPILIGVEVFSTGIDLPGNELTKLVVADLFPLRDDSAYQSWRGRWLESVGGSGFSDYELPERAIMLEQQVGRVIRRVDDEGFVVFYVSDKDWKPGSGGRMIIEEALHRFPGARNV